MLKAVYTVYLLIYIRTSCMCKETQQWII